MTKNLCLNCEFYLSDLACLAFERIPEEILDGSNDHEEITEGQIGEFVFTEKGDKEALEDFLKD